MIHPPRCPACDRPDPLRWWLVSWGIIQELVCFSCGIWCDRLTREFVTRKRISA
jgi:Zn ribbon nucleic-acid-binding protein